MKPTLNNLALIGLTASLLSLSSFAPNPKRSKPTCLLAEEVFEGGGKRVYTLDASDRLVAEISYAKNGGEDSRYTFTYNTSGKLTTLSRSGQELGMTEFIYTGDRISSAKLFIDNNGAWEQSAYLLYQYDKKGHNTRTIIIEGDLINDTASEEVYQYDAAGNLAHATYYRYQSYPHGRRISSDIEYKYDPKRNPVSAFRLPGLVNLGTIGNAVRYITPNNFVASTEKYLAADGEERITIETRAFEYNSNNLPARKSDNYSNAQCTYKYNCK